MRAEIGVDLRKDCDLDADSRAEHAPERGVVDFCVVALVDRQALDEMHRVDSRPGGRRAETRLQLSAATLAFHRQQALSALPQRGRTPDFGKGHRHAFDRKRIKAAARVIDPGGTPPEQPEAAARVETAGIAGAVPYLAVD